MQAAPAPIPRHLPGRSATRVDTGWALFWSAVTLVLLGAFLLPLSTSSSSPRWHLPWPVLQWLVTTLAGNLTVAALGLLVAGPPLARFTVWRCPQEVAQARDVTEVPVAEWPSDVQVGLQPHLEPGWLGVGRWERAMSLALLVLAGALACGVCSACVVLFRAPDLGVGCSDRYGCPPSVSLLSIAMVSIFGAMVLAIGTHAFWLWRVEARCGVWFRYADRTATKPVSYIRQPGVTPEAATDALARACSVRAVPLARQLFFLVLMMSLCSVPLGAAVILEVWLPGQWLPG